MHSIETEARALRGRSLGSATATAALTANCAALDRLVAALLAEETIERDRLDELLGPRAAPAPGDVLPIQVPIPGTRVAQS